MIRFGFKSEYSNYDGTRCVGYGQLENYIKSYESKQAMANI